MIVSYIISGPDNNAYFFAEGPEELFCTACGCLALDKEYLPARLLHLKSPIKDVSSTYDNRLAFSLRAKIAFEKLELSEVHFKQINSRPDLFVIHSTRELAFDSERRRTVFNKFCEYCGQYTEIAGATPGFLAEVYEPILEGLYVTDVLFGSYKEKSPSLLVGIETKVVLEKIGLTGIEFHPVYGAGETVVINGIEF